MVQEIGVSDINRVVSVVQEKFDLDFSNYAVSSFKRRLERLIEVRNCKNIDTLIQKIENNSFSKEEFLHEITVNVTEMFRDPSFWRAIKKVLSFSLESLPKIRIWHAACSSGEEVYSMLIILKEMNLLDKCEIVASDIDTMILARAKEGAIAMRNMELNCKNYARVHDDYQDLMKYFKVEGEYCRFDKSLLSRVSFRNIDLVKAESTSKYDLIFCRNVMIYFNQALQSKVLKLLHQSLFIHSYLVVGTKETISSALEVAPKFISVNNEEKIYKKIKD
jgi:chemotaxis protein methyltransferase CheR